MNKMKKEGKVKAEEYRNDIDKAVENLESDLVNKLKIKKSDFENVLFWRVPDDLGEFLTLLKNYASICLYWSIKYNEQYRITKEAERKYSEYVMGKRDKLYLRYTKDRSVNGKLQKQPTKEDYDSLFLKLYGKSKVRMDLLRKMEYHKKLRDKLASIYEISKMYKDILVVSGNIQNNMLSRGLISVGGKYGKK